MSLDSFKQALRTWHRTAYAIATEDNTFCPDTFYSTVDSYCNIIENEGNELFTDKFFSEDELELWASVLDEIKEVTFSCSLHECGCPCGQATKFAITELFGMLSELFAMIDTYAVATKKDEEDD